MIRYHGQMSNRGGPLAAILGEYEDLTGGALTGLKSAQATDDFKVRSPGAILPFGENGQDD